MRLVEPSVELLFITPNAAQLLEAAGRTCYKSEDKITSVSAVAFVDMIDKRGHHSVIEHAYATFRIVTDRGITHEIVRHRLASYSQESTRYCNYGKSKFGKEITVIAPSGIKEDNPDGSWEVWLIAMQHAEKSYFDMLDTGHPPQIARSVLPNCLKTEIVMTANFREWLHFLKLRTSKAAHPDMRIIARGIGSVLAKECSSVFREYSTRN
jgi:thymidylate synthase (FAD)